MRPVNDWCVGLFGGLLWFATAVTVINLTSGGDDGGEIPYMDAIHWACPITQEGLGEQWYEYVHWNYSMDLHGWSQGLRSECSIYWTYEPPYQWVWPLENDYDGSHYLYPLL